MVKDSFLKQAKLLEIPEEEIAAFRTTCREWLENACDHNDRIVVAILRKPSEARKQAQRFVDHEGVRFFGEAVKKRVISSLRDQKLITIVTKMMVILCGYKEKKLERRKKREKARLEVPSDVESEEMQDCCGSRSSVTPADTEYSPSIITPDTPSNFRQHRTRANTQPGMPPIRSIEVNSDDDLIIVDTQRKKDQRGSDLEKISEKNKTKSSFKKHTDRHKNLPIIPDESSRYDTNTMASSSLTGMNGDEQAHDLLGSDILAPWRGLTPIQIGQASQPLPDLIHDASQTDSLLSLPILDPCTFDFDQFIDAARYRTASVAIRAAPPPVSTSAAPIERVRTPFCQRTPPGSGRSRGEPRSQRNQIPDEVDSKTQMPGTIDNVIDLTAGDKTTVFITPVDCKVILKDKAVQSLQRSFNLLNNASLKYQRLAQDLPTSVDREKAKDKALFIGELLNELKDNRRIWDEGSQLETDSW